jgi:phosphatidylserine decarboxylase
MHKILTRYARHFGVALDEMERPLRDYRSFLEFFTRPLKAGVRPIDADPLSIVSPADGAVHWAGDIESGQLLQVKGHRYAVADLLGSAHEAMRFLAGTALVAYLSPGDYHRYHWPFDAQVTGLRHVRGDLWPVNGRAVRSVPGLFVRNERVVLQGTLPTGGSFAYVPVGALNVGSIRLTDVDLRTNLRSTRMQSVAVPEDWRVERGAECGWFEFGSSIVLLLSADAGRLDPLEPEARLRVGQRIGALAR